MQGVIRMGRTGLWFSLLACAVLPFGCGTGDRGRDAAAVPASATLTASDAASAVSDTELSDPVGSSELESVVVPPTGWRPDPLKRSRNHAHQAWISPSGSTAYGVIRINLPLPFVGPDTVLPRFLNQMRQTEGEARLISRRGDRDLPGIRFVAEGGQYRLRANLVTRGFRAWTVYAGTLRGRPEVADELNLAEAAREQTRIGTTRARSKNR
jgi:hypothetical protein